MPEKRDTVLPYQGRWRARQAMPRTVCVECGSPENLQVHHVDENPLNNDIGNLVVLCCSCHRRRHKPIVACVLCGALQEARGYCKRHYQRWKRRGDPLLVKANQYAPVVRVEG